MLKAVKKLSLQQEEKTLHHHPRSISMGTPETVGLPVPGLSEGPKCLYQQGQQYKKSI
jgi:hypothetical protein